jgi:putative acyl-CoA dehydrogenase
MPTHLVENQPPPLERYDVFSSDAALTEAFSRETHGAPADELVALGERAGRPEIVQLGFDANDHPPELRTHDRFGNRIDEVRYHPAYHALMQHAVENGMHAAPWLDESPSAHVRRAAKFFVWSQVEAGHGCPISMTYAAVPALRVQPEIAATWVPAFAHREYDPRLVPVADKRAALCGMGMTEKQGGSDVRANQTRAVAVGRGGPGAEYLLAGHKWFCSAPMCDAFLVLARTGEGISCFLVPRVLPDGSRNAFAIQRLKSKLGNRSNASSELEFEGTHAWLIGEPGRGVRTIVEMVNHTRLDCIIGSAGLVRQALAQAIHHATYRRTFGKLLIDHSLMQNVLADIALESEANTALFMRLARAIDESPNDVHAAALKRIGTAIGKFFVCKRAPVLIGEALECLGGNGYVEESIMPRLYREAPVNSIWEGSGNINALDVLRILQKQPESLPALQSEIEPVMQEPKLASEAARLARELRDGDAMEARARWLASRLATLWQASLLLQYAPRFVADAFIESRFGDDGGRTLGTLSASGDLRRIVDRAAPCLEAVSAS